MFILQIHLCSKNKFIVFCLQSLKLNHQRDLGALKDLEDRLREELTLKDTRDLSEAERLAQEAADQDFMCRKTGAAVKIQVSTHGSLDSFILFV